MDILNQLGGLLLGAVPTMVFFLIVVVAYGFLVRRPLDKVLAERRALTSGAVEQAKAMIAKAEAETADYEAKLRAARAEVAAAREERNKQLQKRRDEAVEAARSKAHERVGAVKAEIAKAAADARKQIEDATLTLSDQIVRAVLPAGTYQQGAAQG